MYFVWTAPLALFAERQEGRVRPFAKKVRALPNERIHRFLLSDRHARYDSTGVA